MFSASCVASELTSSLCAITDGGDTICLLTWQAVFYFSDTLHPVPMCVNMEGVVLHTTKPLTQLFVLQFTSIVT